MLNHDEDIDRFILLHFCESTKITVEVSVREQKPAKGKKSQEKKRKKKRKNRRKKTSKSDQGNAA
jgi:hypothetical protein